MNGPALMSTENRNGERVITFSSGIFNPENPKDPRNYSKTHGIFKDTTGIFDIFGNTFDKLFKFLFLLLSSAFGGFGKEKEVNKTVASTSQAQAPAQSQAQAQKPVVDDNVNLMNVVATKFSDRDMIKDGIKGSELLSVLEKTLDRMNTPVLLHYKEILKDNPDHSFRHSPIEFIDLLARTDNQKIPLEAMEKELDRERDNVARDNLGSVKLPKNGGYAEIEKLLAQDDQIRLSFLAYIKKTPELKQYIDALKKDPKTTFVAGYSLADLIKEAEGAQAKISDEKSISDVRAEAQVDQVIGAEKEKLNKDVRYGHTTFNTPLGRELSLQNGEKQLETMEKDFKNFISEWNHKDRDYLKDNENLGQLISILSYGRKRVESFGLNYDELAKAYNDEVDYRRLFADDRVVNLGMATEFLKNLTEEKKRFLEQKVAKSQNIMVENVIENLYAKENSADMSANTASFLIQSKLLSEKNFSNGWFNFFENFDSMRKIQVKMRDGSYMSILKYGEDLNQYSSSDAEYYLKIAESRRPTIFRAEAEKKSDEIGSVFEKPKSYDLKDDLTHVEVKGINKGIDKEELAKTMSDSNISKTATSTINSFGMMND